MFYQAYVLGVYNLYEFVFMTLTIVQNIYTIASERIVGGSLQFYFDILHPQIMQSRVFRLVPHNFCNSKDYILLLSIYIYIRLKNDLFNKVTRTNKDLNDFAIVSARENSSAIMAD